MASPPTSIPTGHVVRRLRRFRRDNPHPNVYLEYVKKELQKPPLSEIHLAPGDIDTETYPLPLGWQTSALADVVIGWSNQRNMEVAIKKIRWGLVTDTALANRVVSQVKIWDELTRRAPHPNILPLIGFFVDDSVNLISQFMDNGTAAMHVRSKTRSAKDIFEIVIGIAAGLEHMHSKGMIHGDLKCSRIVISDSGVPLLTGFDVSRWVKLGIEATWGLGTVNFMAPELTTSSNGLSAPTPMSDMWSFAMVIFELLDSKGTVNERVLSPDEDLKVPEGILTGNHDDDRYFNTLWSVCLSCRKVNPSERLSASAAKNALSDLEQRV